MPVFTTHFGEGYPAYTVLLKLDEYGDTVWTMTHNILVNSIQQTTDGGFILAGYIRNLDSHIAAMMKIDADGNAQWFNSYPGEYLSNTGYSVCQTSQGDYIMVGELEIRFEDHENTNVSIIKTNENGDTLWTRAIGLNSSSHGSYDEARSIIENSDGDFVIGGNSYYDFLLIKINTFGDTIWTRTYGGDYIEDAGAVIQSSDGGYIIAGWTASYGAGDKDIWIVKTNSIGGMVWSKTIGTEYEETACSIIKTSDNEFAIAGIRATGGYIDHDFYLVKLAADQPYPTYAYWPGDVNMFNGEWPPRVIGSDVTYLVNYFRGLPSSQPCLQDSFWNSADINGDCGILGSDVTRLVNYFRGEAYISPCFSYETIWLATDDLPVEAPENWPNCE
ncbi:MAG: hypothetical protein GY839_03415 [candidate division Zixibacteria bacterium]|nr:hypothetical protein [candidate division Zixibacteria bacterium]